MVSIVVCTEAKMSCEAIMAYLEKPLGNFLLFANTDLTQYAERQSRFLPG